MFLKIKVIIPYLMGISLIAKLVDLSNIEILIFER